jgi:hypothetical protein
MNPRKGHRRGLRRDHPLFFWGMAILAAVLLAATAAVAMRIPRYRADAALLDERMSESERATRDRVLRSEARRGELAVALLQRELRLRAMQEKKLHLAIDTQRATLALRHGDATLRETSIDIGPDSVVRAPDGRTWRLVRALGERHIEAKERSPVYTVPDWVYVSRGEPVPPEGEREIEGGLGRFVLRLDDGTEIYSEPTRGPFAGHVKPAAFAVPEAELRSIFDAVGSETPVYIY